MPLKQSNQCPNCSRWFNSSRSLKLHITSCRQKHFGVEELYPTNVSQTNKSTNGNTDDNDSHVDDANEQSFVTEDIVDYGHLFENTDNRSHSDNEETTSDESTDVCYQLGKRTNAITKLQVRLNDIINNHKASLKMHDDLVTIFNEYISSPNFDKYAKLKSRKSFIRDMENEFNVSHLRPKQMNVSLHDGSQITVPVFDAKSMIMDILTNDSCMQPQNIATGYDLFSGDVNNLHPDNQKYGEIHTGDCWLPARDIFCPKVKNEFNMPAALIIFGDKSHTDLHGALALTPIIFTLTMFNRQARNNTHFWRPLGYIPNLTHGKNKADRTKTSDKIQDEHNCLAMVLKSVKDLHRKGGFAATVMGRQVTIKVWIHFFIGDTEGNNKWLGHYPGNRKGICRPYRDCKCEFDQLCCVNPQCEYTTLDDMRHAKRIKRYDERKGQLHFQKISRYDICNALSDKFLPLSDLIHGPYRMTPPELLHTSGSGIILYMFESLRMQIGNGKDRDEIDKLHIRISLSIRRQSERDFPRGAMRNGLIDGTKCQAEERRGNLFLLLCIAHTIEGSEILRNGMQLTTHKWKRWIECIKLYLSMEEWFHDANDKREVDSAREMIGEVLKMVQTFFPREEKTNGYCIPKMHAMTKFQSYIKRYGSAINFYGGPGEAAHKYFVKAPGQKTQRRVSEFAVQTANQCYDMIVTKHAMTSIGMEMDRVAIIRNINKEEEKTDEEIGIGIDDVSVIFYGKYILSVTKENLESMNRGDHIYVSWLSDKNNVKQDNDMFSLNDEIVRYIADKVTETSIVTGYTRATITNMDGEKVIFYSHPCFQGTSRYDWAYVHFQEISANGTERESYYPSRILGFLDFNGGNTEAIIQCASKSLLWSDVESDFFSRIRIDNTDNLSIVSVPISALVHPLCVFPDSFIDSNESFFVVLPKRNWSRYFGRKINNECINL